MLEQCWMDMYRLNDGEGLRPEDFCGEMFQAIDDILQIQPPDPGSPAAMLLSDHLGEMSPPCRMDEMPSDLLPSLHSKWDTDLELTGADGSRVLLNKPGNEKCPQTPMLDCKVCGKVFSSVSSLNKHCATHSQERRHICKVCKKAFKRQDHLMGHKLTHLKVKPFVCTEPECSKSYCDFRSLRRHYEIHHGLLIKQQKVPAAKPSRAIETASVPPALPSSDLIRCLVTEILQQKVISNMVVLQDPKAILVPQMMTLNSSKTNEDVAPVNTYTLINSTSKLSMGPDYVWCSDPPPVSPPRCLPPKIQPMENSYSTGSFDVAAVNGAFIEASAGNLHSLDHMYVSPPADNGCETTGEQYLSTHDPDFTRPTHQPCDLSEFQVQKPPHIFLPMTNSQSHAASLPSMSMPQCIQETNSIRGWGDLQSDPQELPTLSRIIRAPENVTSGSQNGSSTAQPGQESQKLSSSSREMWPKLGRSQRKSTTTKSQCSLSLSSTVPASQVALNSFLATNKFQDNERLNRLFMSNQRDIQEEEVRSWQQKVEPTTQSLESETWTTRDTTAGHLVIPVSVPVTKKDQEKEGEINGIRNDLQRNTTEKGKKTRPCPKPLYIPPPVLEKNSSGCFQSSMRSPETLLSEYLQSGAPLCQFTPPPMLSPIRQGTGLYFNTFCTPSSAKYQPPALDEEDGERICLVKDLMLYPVQPHINIGDRFQAVIPECRDHSLLEGEEEKADLVWRPCLPTVVVSRLLDFACSSAVPRGGCNLELALHCLHFSRGNVLEALDKLLGKEQQKLLPRCLADYHYAGSDHWSGTEKRQFKKAYYKQQKNFSYIQSTIPGKSIYQCVEYYYTWKKILGLKRLIAEQSFDREESQGRKEPHSEVKIKSKNQKKATEPKYLKSQEETRDGEEPKKFACQQCDRVFEKVKSRNAHMKKHRVQEYNAKDFYC